MKNSVLQNKVNWEKTNRWDDELVDNWFKTKLKSGSNLGLAFTHEEAMTNLMKTFISSHRDLPAYPYDIRTMFRNEKRAKSGLMRGREFYWKALYSFSRNREEHQKFYEQAQKAYQNIFRRVGLGNLTYLTFASGGTFSKYSHEFQTLSEAGEDIIYIDQEKNLAVNKEVFNDKVLAELGIKDKSKLKKAKAIEVGNIFTLGTKFSEPLDLKFKDENGKEHFVFMGSYGIGISRLLGTIVEVFADDKGIVWPAEVSPFQVHLIDIDATEEAEKIYQDLRKEGVEVFWDDRPDKKPGEKFADADLLGFPWRLVVSSRSLQAGGAELKRRTEKEAQIVKTEELKDILKNQ